MSTRRKNSPPPARPGEAYTLVDEMLASPDHPMPPADAAERAGAARAALEDLQTAGNPAVMSWRVCAMVGNLIETMLELGFIDDPTGLLPEAQEALRGAAERALARQVPIRFTGQALAAVTWMIDGFEDVLTATPHRKMIRAFRETSKRMVMLDRGARRPTDYILPTRNNGTELAAREQT